ncbi:MAG: homocysteine S-methyltransferase family protein [Candidatus Omnitrophica bacterium]|nr:homocysteine S-methyltransferase family protein [Candidatus Omnitrophota bacterium]MBU4478928.1 homocysteine S-methyltransferase family protein [Candidatus Omnitrophota bacterium]MCG2704387.1 homocysteine S-methyltransferase family protein [Candidatus Omnitrophota bacterium]
MTDIRTLLKRRVVVLDGAMGTELQKRGMPQGICPEIWCLENPDVLKSVHADYSRAGADIVYTCTFGANRVKLAQYGKHDARKVNRQLVRLARQAAGKNTLIAGDIAPTGKFVEPFGPLGFEEAVSVYKEQVKGLLEAGVDLFVIETMMDIQEARAALIAVKELTSKFTMVSMTYEKSGMTLNGTDPLTALITLQSLGADAVGCNCSSGPEQMIRLIEAMKPYAKVPLIAKPNAGMPRLLKGKTSFSMDAKEFAAFGKRLVQSGVNFLGGCCGTTPEHIAAVKKSLTGIKPVPLRRRALSALSSARSHVILEDSRALCVAGECINPTGKKDLQEALRSGKMAIVRSLAKAQQEKGAQLLDVNAGVAGIDEKITLTELIRTLCVSTKLPLVIDSADEEAIEQALRIYPGRALINSISGEKKKIKKLLPLAAKYGAMFILLPLSDKHIPQTFEGRKKIVQQVFRKAAALGLSKSDVVVDGLVMSVSSFAQSALVTMKTIHWAARSFKVNTICGLSNISFGMPCRSLLNKTCRSLFRKQGLSMVIDNPLRKSSGYNKYAANVLLSKDKDAAEYIAYCKQLSEGKPADSRPAASADKSPQDKVFAAIVEGYRGDVKEYVLEALNRGAGALTLVNEVMIPAINRVGSLFDKKEYFLPQLIAGAETMRIAFEILAPYLKNSGDGENKKTVFIIATVEGDIHDIGKNIVALMLQNHGFSVIDLGKDVPVKKIINEIKKHERPLVGLSALMTTTMVHMREIIECAGNEGLKCGFMVGGAVVTKGYAASIGAEYARDGVEAVRVAKQLENICLNKKK